MRGISGKHSCSIARLRVGHHVYTGSGLYAHMNEGGPTLTTRLTVFREYSDTALPLMVREI